MPNCKVCQAPVVLTHYSDYGGHQLGVRCSKDWRHVREDDLSFEELEDLGFPESSVPDEYTYPALPLGDGGDMLACRPLGFAAPEVLAAISDKWTYKTLLAAYPFKSLQCVACNAHLQSHNEIAAHEALEVKDDEVTHTVLVIYSKVQ